MSSNIKILYAGGRYNNSKIQLFRFIKNTLDKPYCIKIAAYKQYSPNINIDWTLDCLLNVYNPVQLFVDNDNFRIYVDQIKSFNPDLIISDFEFFTSYAGFSLNIPVWQCSSAITNFALHKKEKYNLGLFKQYSYLFNKNPNTFQRNYNIVENSNKKFVYSHFGDIAEPIELQAGYQFVRPYHQIGKKSKVCEHNLMAATISVNKNIINLMNQYQDNVFFSDFIDEKYDHVVLKNIYNEEEYFCNLYNCKHFVTEGQITFLADSFYNNKKSWIVNNFEDTECLLNSIISEKYLLSEKIKKQLDTPETIEYSLNKEISFLHDQIDLFFDRKNV